jgi:hypothetical protein
LEQTKEIKKKKNRACELFLLYKKKKENVYQNELLRMKRDRERVRMDEVIGRRKNREMKRVKLWGIRSDEKVYICVHV